MVAGGYSRHARSQFITTSIICRSLLPGRKYAAIGGLRIVVNKPLLDFRRETLALQGLDEQRLLLLEDGEAIRPRATLVPHPARPGLLQDA